MLQPSLSRGNITAHFPDCTGSWTSAWDSSVNVFLSYFRIKKGVTASPKKDGGHPHVTTVTISQHDSTDTDHFSREVLHPVCASPLTHTLDRPFNTSDDSGSTTDSEGGENISNAKAPADGLRSFFTCDHCRSLCNDPTSLSEAAGRRIASHWIVVYLENTPGSPLKRLLSRQRKYLR